MKKIFLLLIFSLLCLVSSAREITDVSLSCDTIRYFVGTEEIIIYNICLNNHSNKNFYIWLNKNISSGRSEEEHILDHFIIKQDARSSSLYQIAMETDFTITHEIYTTFTVKLSPGKHFLFLLLQEGNKSYNKGLDVVGCLKNQLEIYDEVVISKQLKGFKAFNSRIFYPRSFIILPLQKIKQP